MTIKLIRDLKTLFHNWIYYQDEDEDNYHEWLNQYTGYIQGSLSIESGLPETITQSFDDITVNIYDELYHFVIHVPAGLSNNQTFTISNANIRHCTISSQAKSIDVTFTRSNNQNPVLILEPKVDGSYYYTGCSITFKINQGV